MKQLAAPTVFASSQMLSTVNGQLESLWALVQIASIGFEAAL
jgi:hypothetical protein